jgi:hypothetical protein
MRAAIATSPQLHIFSPNCYHHGLSYDNIFWQVRHSKCPLPDRMCVCVCVCVRAHVRGRVYQLMAAGSYRLELAPRCNYVALTLSHSSYWAWAETAVVCCACSYVMDCGRHAHPMLTQVTVNGWTSGGLLRALLDETHPAPPQLVLDECLGIPCSPQTVGHADCVTVPPPQ